MSWFRYPFRAIERESHEFPKTVSGHEKPGFASQVIACNPYSIDVPRIIGSIAKEERITARCNGQCIQGVLRRGPSSCVTYPTPQATLLKSERKLYSRLVPVLR